MGKKDRSVTVRNLTTQQYAWLEREAERTGQSVSAIFRMWIQKQIDAAVKDGIK